MENVVILSAARTAVGAYLGTLRTIKPEYLGAYAIEEARKRADIDKKDVDLIVLGHVMIDGEARNIARVSGLLAGFDIEVPAYSVDIQCGSGLLAVRDAVMELQCGECRVAIAGGTESMSRGIYYLPPNFRYEGFKAGHFTVYDSFVRGSECSQPPDLYPNLNMGLTAENVAAHFGITREEQDAFALDSQRKAEAAIKSGRLKDEIFPVMVPQKKGDPIVFDTDEHPRFGTTMESLSKLKPAFKKDGTGTVTPGNSSGMNDGASAVVLTTESTAQEMGKKPMARILAHQVVGCDPSEMGLGPVEATRKVLKKAGLELEDMDLIELNEAFAAQSLGVLKELDIGMDTEMYKRVNVNGGAIAHGHALANSGTRLLTTLIYELKKRHGKYGLATLCIGGGEGIAMVIENIE